MVQIMAWRRPGGKPLSEQCCLNYQRIYASLGLNEFISSLADPTIFYVALAVILELPHWFSFVYFSHCNACDCRWHPAFKWIAVTWEGSRMAVQGPVSLRLMTSQFKDIVTHTQKMKTVKCTLCGVWVQNFVWNFKGALWNFTQNFEPIHRKICILRGVKNSTTYDILELWHLKS